VESAINNLRALSTIQDGDYQQCPAPWCAIWQLCSLSTPAPFLVSATSIACGRVSNQDERFITTGRVHKVDGDRYQPIGSRTLSEESVVLANNCPRSDRRQGGLAVSQTFYTFVLGAGGTVGWTMHGVVDGASVAAQVHTLCQCPPFLVVVSIICGVDLRDTCTRHTFQRRWRSAHNMGACTLSVPSSPCNLCNQRRCRPCRRMGMSPGQIPSRRHSIHS